MNTLFSIFETILNFFYVLLFAMVSLLVDVILPIAGIVLTIAVVLLGIALVRTLTVGKKSSTYVPTPDKKREENYAHKLSEMVKCETVSEFGVSAPEKFRVLHTVMEQQFPLVFAKCEKFDIDGNLVMYWKGKTSANPIMLMSHIDVVAAGPNWSHDPFGGEISGGKVWGRGTADTKCSVMAFYQAAEELLAEGYVPPVDVYLCSSCTEEVGGDGAPKIVNWLKSRGVHLAMLSDEGGGIINEPIGGIPGNFAMVGVYEKGSGDLKFTARSHGGHASAPSKNTPIARLAKFIAHVEKKNPMLVKFSPEVEEMFTRLAPYAGFPLRFVLGNLWLFKPVLRKALPLISAQAAAMLQTTVAFTTQKGSDGYNIIPQEAYVTANLRFIPHQKVKESVAVLTKLAAKYNIETEIIAAMDPSPSLDLNGRAFKLTEAAIARTFPGLPASPYVVTGATDCRFYNDVCDNCVRFSPVIYGPEQMKGMHGIDENIETNCLPGAVDYYRNLITMQEEF
ncbi:MAG: M20/M25/M40 family metallo-hydrolase [Oscillospiraceae bacterium]|nr:M20/M25/M40 family metallo-hydrolase [Oscillospiraceae bacterium]